MNLTVWQGVVVLIVLFLIGIYGDRRTTTQNIEAINPDPGNSWLPAKVMLPTIGVFFYFAVNFFIALAKQ